ncbi:hypothetical protein, partial [Vibrio sonorensis]|uniref:hypothetical protein n=1 Tax=Vibrio sonorensis TaxID=1004316 RepID=UPI001C2F896B
FFGEKSVPLSVVGFLFYTYPRMPHLLFEIGSVINDWCRPRQLIGELGFIKGLSLRRVIERAIGNGDPLDVKYQYVLYPFL